MTVAVALLVIIGSLALMMRGALYGGAGHATPQAAQELAEIREWHMPQLAQDESIDPELTECLHQVLEHFFRTQDVRYTEGGFGILHVACIFKKKELVRCLLLDKADPNGVGATDDSPLLLALGTGMTPGISARQLTELVDTLLDAGARPELATMQKDGADFLTQAVLVCEREEVILHLMDRGIKPDGETAYPLALHGWKRALERTLEAKPDTEGLLHAAAKGVCRFEGEHEACLAMLLERGADVNAGEEGKVGHTPLFWLAQGLSSMESSSSRYAQAVAAADFLLKHGASPYLRAEEDDEYPGFCPYDFFAMNPGVAGELRGRGNSLDEPPLQFSDGVPLLAEVCRAAMRSYSAEQLGAHFERIAAVLTPSPEMRRHELYPQALTAAVTLLARCDAARACERICAMPLWQQELPPGGSGEAIIPALVSALREEVQLAPDKGFICSQAERLLAAGWAEAAAEMVELLARCPDAQKEVEQYCTDSRLPLQAGGFAARLYAAGLPDARNNGVVDWMHKKGITTPTPFLEEAILLTSLERLWFGQMPQEEQSRMLELMRKIGAKKAADAYEYIASHLDDPEQLDALMERGDLWKYELEAATARFFLEHSRDFTSLVP